MVLSGEVHRSRNSIRAFTSIWFGRLIRFLDVQICLDSGVMPEIRDSICDKLLQIEAGIGFQNLNPCATAVEEKKGLQVEDQASLD